MMQEQKPVNIPANAFPPPLMPAVPRGTFLPDPPKNNWATLNLVFAIFGYLFFGALLSPLSVIFGLEVTDSWMVNYPIRAVQIVVAGYCCFVVGKNRAGAMQWTWMHTILTILFVMSSCRLLYDFMFPEHLNSITAWCVYEFYNPLRCWGYWFVNLLTLASVMKTIHLVDFDKAIKWLFWGCLVGVVASAWSVVQIVAQEEILKNQNIEVGRFTAGISLHTQALGGYGAYAAMIGAYYFWKLKGMNVVKILAVLLIALGIYIAARAGSRGPFLMVLVVGGFFLMTKTKYAAIGVPVAGVFGAIAYALRYQVVELLGLINPAIKFRLLATIDSGDTSGRTDLWVEYFDMLFKENPILGLNHTYAGYCHSTVFDGFMMYGIFLGWLQIVPVVLAMIFGYRLIKSGDRRGWLAIFVLAMFSQCFTQSEALGTGVVLIAALYILKTSRKNANLILNRGPVL